jgi:hypothetical protein
VKGGKPRYVAPTGMVGSGFLEESFAAALAREPDFIGSDGGSTDDGPHQLGSGGNMFEREACKRDLRIMLRGAVEKGIPLLVGSVGGAGSKPHLDWTRTIVEEIASEEGLHFRLALIDSEQDKHYVKAQLANGRVKPLDPAPEISPELIDANSHVVGMMGVEPFQAAVEDGAQVVLAGRSSDTSVFAALPLRDGVAPGPAWHAAKILECGAAATEQRLHPDSMFCTFEEDAFIVEPLHPRMRCTPVSVASHSLYENADPYYLREPSGVLDTSVARYSQEGFRATRVAGSRFQHADQYTIKLEGAQLVGYQTIVLGAIRDPLIIRQLDSWLESLEDSIAKRVEDIYAGEPPGGYLLNLRVYGRNGVMGALEPVREITSHEVCLLLDVTAQDQATATTIAASGGHIALHHPIPEWSGLISALAFPYGPHRIERGAVYRFTLNHVVEVDDPLEMFRTELVDV